VSLAVSAVKIAPYLLELIRVPVVDNASRFAFFFLLSFRTGRHVDQLGA